MRTFDWLVVIVMGVVGWLVVSFLMNRSKRSQGEDERAGPDRLEGPGSFGSGSKPEPHIARLPAPAAPIPAAHAPVPGPTPRPVAVSDTGGESADLLSLDEMGRSWHLMLGVSGDASAGEIETAYHAKLAECDRVRFSSDTTPTARRQAEQQRARISQAYEFIRPSRQ